MIALLLVVVFAWLSPDERMILRVRACEHLTRTMPDGTVVVKWSCPSALKTSPP